MLPLIIKVTSQNIKFLRETKVIKGNLVIWKTNNRLLYMQCVQFLEKFCKIVNITNITVKTRTNIIKNYFAFQFDLEETTHRWSYMQCVQFLAKFCKIVNITVKTRTKS